MKLLKEDFLELEIGTSVESIQKSLDSQKELFHSQIDQLQRIVATQCNLTGVNPLSQEMAAGALSIKIGKRPRDLINPKAVKHMQSIFAIKDAISKKESREIGALFGITVTQVRDFFNSQRTRVRRLVRLSREKAVKPISGQEVHDRALARSDSLIPIDAVPLNSIGPSKIEEAPSTSMQDDALPILDDSDKQFVDNVFNLMYKEETFSGKEKLMEWILHIQNELVLCWFLSRGGMMILATWLSQATTEEQTSVLLLIIKVLCHLPLHKALPIHISAILQSINELRFYRTSDISNRARVLLSRLSKLLARSQGKNKANGVKACTNSNKELMLTQSSVVEMDSGLWPPTLDAHGNMVAPVYEGSENNRKSDLPQAVKLLTASTDESNKKPILGLSSYTRERRKVQLMEQPGQKTMSRGPQVSRTLPGNQARPMSADDIQKAKMRAVYMQNRYGKNGVLNENKEIKGEGQTKPSNNPTGVLPSLANSPLGSKIEETKNTSVYYSENSSGQKASLDLNVRMDSCLSIPERCKRVRVSWKTPAEVKLNEMWRVGTGENSKEADVQKNRNRRDKEIIYHMVEDIPRNPKEPWDFEMDYDDTLTPEIPIEQMPDSDAAETAVTPSQRKDSPPRAVASSSQGSNVTAEPDLELLAVLLKNPELVFALTSGQAGNLSSEDTVRLLDVIKNGGVSLAENLNGAGGKAGEMVEVSLPSPTPPTNPAMGGWKAEVAKNPFSRQGLMQNRSSNSNQLVTTSNLVLPQAQATSTPRQQSTALQPLTQPLTGSVTSHSLPRATAIPHKQHPSSLPSMPRTLLTNALNVPPSTNTDLTMKNLSNTGVSSLHLPPLNVQSAMQVEGMGNVRPLSNLVASRTAETFFPQTSSLPSPTPTHTSAVQLQAQSQMLQQSLISKPSHIPTYHHRQQIEKQKHISDAWRPRQDLPANYHSQFNQNNNNALVGGYKQPASYERNDFVVGQFESWSPENSPTRNPGYPSGRNLSEFRANPGRNNGPDWPRQQNPSGYPDHSRQPKRTWSDRGR